MRRRSDDDGLARVIEHLQQARVGLIKHGSALPVDDGERLRVVAAHRALVEVCQMYGLLTTTPTGEEGT